MCPTGLAECYVMRSDSGKTERLVQSIGAIPPTVFGATAIPEFVVEAAEHEIAHGRRPRRHGLIFMSTRRTGESRACLEVAPAREAAGRGAQGDE